MMDADNKRSSDKLRDVTVQPTTPNKAEPQTVARIRPADTSPWVEGTGKRIESIKFPKDQP